jgi:ribokinase
MILNEQEFAQLTGSASTEQPQDIIATLESYASPLPCCIITLGPAGLVLAEHDRAPIHIGGHKVATLDTTGAGDCLAGWFAAELAAGRSLEDAARRANAAAAISVTRAGAGSSMPTRSEAENFLRH